MADDTTSAAVPADGEQFEKCANTTSEDTELPRKSFLSCKQTNGIDSLVGNSAGAEDQMDGKADDKAPVIESSGGPTSPSSWVSSDGSSSDALDDNAANVNKA